ncbi:MAG: peptidylprolyl isomerase [Pseudomonadota bacterium]
MTLKMFSKTCAGMAMAAVVAFGSASAPTTAQTVAVPTSDNPFGIPENITIFKEDNPNRRFATAIVNDYVITGTDIDQRVALVTSASNAEVSPEEMQRLRLQVLRNLIDETLKVQAAEAQDMKVERAEVEQTYSQLAAQNFGQEPEKMAEYLLSIGSSPDALKRQIEGEIAWENLLRRNVTNVVNVSAEEVNEVLERQKRDRGTEEYRLGEIYLSATSENDAAVLNNANQIIEQLRAGGSFQGYARQFSEATTAAVGGDLDFVRLGQLPPQLANVARAMRIGELQGPIKIPGGYSILYLIDKRQVLTADPRDSLLSLKQISVGFPPDVETEAANAKIAEFSNFIQNLRGCADADATAASIGARVVTNDQIKARDLPVQLQPLILGLQVGQATPPFGSAEDGVRVLMLCGRDDPEEANAPTFASVERSIEEDRINKRAQRFLRDLRNDAYIEYN